MLLFFGCMLCFLRRFVGRKRCFAFPQQQQPFFVVKCMSSTYAESAVTQTLLTARERKHELTTAEFALAYRVLYESFNPSMPMWSLGGFCGGLALSRRLSPARMGLRRVLPALVCAAYGGEASWCVRDHCPCDRFVQDVRSSNCAMKKFMPAAVPPAQHRKEPHRLPIPEQRGRQSVQSERFWRAGSKVAAAPLGFAPER